MITRVFSGVEHDPVQGLELLESLLQTGNFHFLDGHRGKEFPSPRSDHSFSQEFCILSFFG